MELRRWLDDNAAEYEEAQKILRSPKKMLEWLKALQAKASDIMRYDPFIHPDSAAVGVVCATQERFAGMFEDLDFLQEYEDRKDRFMKAVRAIGGLEPTADDD